MARKREYDSNLVLSASANVFASTGYAGSSIDMLVEATGLQRGSIYGAFSSKAGLFRAVLAQYVEHIDDLNNNMTFIDLLIVAMWERAHIDKEVHTLVSVALAHIIEEGKSIPDTFYSRMSERAKLSIPLHQFKKELIW
jgi:AcrR family transcriptional regulator